MRLNSLAGQPVELSLNQLTTAPCCEEFDPASYPFSETSGVIRCHGCNTAWEVDITRIDGMIFNVAISPIPFEDIDIVCDRDLWR